MRKPDLENPDISVDVVMTQWPATITVFLRHRMLCVGCLVNPFHTLIDACREYNLDEVDFRAELYAAIAAV